MKKHIIFFLIVIANTVFAGNSNNIVTKKLVSGKVIDKISGEEIAGAEIKIDDRIIFTDLNGNFSTSIDIMKTEAVIKYISYNDAKITLDPLSYNTIAIELVSK